jgi:hypothetical protein
LKVFNEDSGVMLFLSEVDKVSALPMIANPANIEHKLQLSAKKGSGTEISIEGPEEDTFRSFLLGLRKFLAEKESTSFYRIHNTCYKLVEDPLFREHLKLNRFAFKSTLKGAPFMLVIGGKQIVNEEIVDLYFNGELFHLDEHKAKRLNEIRTLPSDPIFQFILRTATTSLFMYIRNLSNIIRLSDNHRGLESLMEAMTSREP